MPHRRRVKTLRGDFEADEDQDRIDRDLWDDDVQVTEVAEDAGAADEERGGEDVRRPSAHRFVGGMTDVGRRLNDAATESRDERGECFNGDDLPRVVFVADRGGAL